MLCIAYWTKTDKENCHFIRNKSICYRSQYKFNLVPPLRLQIEVETKPERTPRPIAAEL